MFTEDFYSLLPRLENFRDITDRSNFRSLPQDWYILVTDIISSTEAVETGRYKEVNLIGACSIIAILNIANNIEIPFVFGGDGASILIPPSLLAKAKQALLATQKLAKQEFKLDLRIGAVAVADVLRGGNDVKVAKFKVSENYSQGIFIGGGLTYATDLIKDTINGESYQIKNMRLAPRANFSGLECRWQDIPSRHGETVSLLVLADNQSRHNSNLYKEVLEQIQKIYGDDEDIHPIHKRHLKLSFNFKKLFLETKVLGKSRKWTNKIMYLLNIQIQNLLGLCFMRFNLRLGMNWGSYKNIVSAATDYRKFDDMLRMVIAGTSAQREELTRYLEKRHQEGKLVYGLHVSNRALMTCIVFERNGRQVHFVDGADGGYASAAKAMKARMNDVLVQV